MNVEKKEESLQNTIDFTKLLSIAKLGLEVVPCAVQDAQTGEVLNVAYVNQEAVQYTLTHKVAAFWSTSRNELWIKGATSGDYLDIVDVRVNCEQNSFVYIVKLRAGAQCHTGRKSCYYRRVLSENHLDFI
jgi:phosphoribosyl-AMP cyclohydrolase